MGVRDDLTQACLDTLEVIPEAIAIFDRNDRFVFWNRRFAEASGVGLTLRAGIRYAEHLRACLSAGFGPNSAGCEDEWLADRLVDFARADGAREHRLGDGRRVWMQDRQVTSADRTGDSADTAKTREREPSFRLLFEANPVPMIVADLGSHAILAVNDAAVAFYGYSHAAFLTLTIRDIRPERSRGEIAAFIDAYLADQGRVSSLVTHRTASGEEKVVRMSGRRLEHGDRPAVLAAIFDLTDQHRAEQEVSRARGS